MHLNEYIKQIEKRYSEGISTEHSYRADLQNLLLNIINNISVTNEPKRQKCGAPDYIIHKKGVPIGYIEAKDIGIDLDKTEKSDQMKRYLASLSNLILTDYLEFRFYRYGQKVKEIKMASVENNKVIAHNENFDTFITHIKDFCDFTGVTIKSAEKLSQIMAQKARMMEEVLFNAVSDDEDENNTLRDQLEAFQKVLIHDLSEKTFSDIYAQTIAYGLFAARLNDDTPENFTRREAIELIPKSNPFLRQLFKYVSDPDLDIRIDWIIDDLADVFRATDLQAILEDFGKSTEQNDPFIHFYETFLAEYDPKLRKMRGVYYTPEPVVNFIVRAVDDILKEDFGLSMGLADSTKIKIQEDTTITDKRTKAGVKQIEREVHKVQILDPATGTGTFLAETIKQIYRKFKVQQGIWASYIENHLIPRINGFEILMASYTMCHIKLEMLLKETGYKPQEDKTPKRLRIFLTNSLEEAHPDTGTLFATWLSNEAKEANNVKQNTPVMVVMGNPPYSVSSSNKSSWIEGLMADYKKDLNEKNIQPLSDDYIKFIRFGQHFIDKNGEGVLAFISNNSFIDGIIHRQMRKYLLESFDKIYILDLHGNAKKKETAPDGSKDENVFDIMQGVSINIFVKNNTKKTNELGKVYHYDLYGKRDSKYDFLMNNTLKKVAFETIQNTSPNYFFVGKDFSLKDSYDNFIYISRLFIFHNAGIVTARDNFTIQFSSQEVKKLIDNFILLEIEVARNKYNLGEDSRDWKIENAQKDLIFSKNNVNNIVPIDYRPFDKRYIYYTNKVRGFLSYPRYDIFQHIIKKDNISLISTRLLSSSKYNHFFISKDIVDKCTMSNRGKETNYVFPLYLYPDGDQHGIIDKEARKPNLNMEIVNEIVNKLKLVFTAEKEPKENTFAPIDILDYIYAVLHSPTYREKYKEFLKIDFPRVPYPENKETFWRLVKLGGELRTIHLLENPIVENYITSYPIDGDNIITRKLTSISIGFELIDSKQNIGRVWINDKQYFDGVPLVAWEFYIGGYQPAQKWLKDRIGRELSFDDISHYQKIIVALSETDRLMKEIDTIQFD